MLKAEIGGEHQHDDKRYGIQEAAQLSRGQRLIIFSIKRSLMGLINMPGANGAAAGGPQL